MLSKDENTQLGTKTGTAFQLSVKLNNHHIQILTYPNLTVRGLIQQLNDALGTTKYIPLILVSAGRLLMPDQLLGEYKISQFTQLICLTGELSPEDQRMVEQRLQVYRTSGFALANTHSNTAPVSNQTVSTTQQNHSQQSSSPGLSVQMSNALSIPKPVQTTVRPGIKYAWIVQSKESSIFKYSAKNNSVDKSRVHLSTIPVDEIPLSEKISSTEFFASQELALNAFALLAEKNKSYAKKGFILHFKSVQNKAAFDQFIKANDQKKFPVLIYIREQSEAAFYLYGQKDGYNLKPECLVSGYQNTLTWEKDVELEKTYKDWSRTKISDEMVQMEVSDTSHRTLFYEIGAHHKHRRPETIYISKVVLDIKHNNVVKIKDDEIKNAIDPVYQSLLTPNFDFAQYMQEKEKQALKAIEYTPAMPHFPNNFERISEFSPFAPQIHPINNHNALVPHSERENDDLNSSKKQSNDVSVFSCNYYLAHEKPLNDHIKVLEIYEEGKKEPIFSLTGDAEYLQFSNSLFFPDKKYQYLIDAFQKGHASDLTTLHGMRLKDQPVRVTLSSDDEGDFIAASGLMLARIFHDNSERFFAANSLFDKEKSAPAVNIYNELISYKLYFKDSFQPTGHYEEDRHNRKIQYVNFLKKFMLDLEKKTGMKPTECVLYPAGIINYVRYRIVKDTITEEIAYSLLELALAVTKTNFSVEPAPLSLPNSNSSGHGLFSSQQITPRTNNLSNIKEISRKENNQEINTTTTIIPSSSNSSNHYALSQTFHTPRATLGNKESLISLLKQDFNQLDNIIQDSFVDYVKLMDLDKSDAMTMWKASNNSERLDYLCQIEKFGDGTLYPALLSNQAAEFYQICDKQIWINANQDLRKSMLKEYIDLDTQRVLTTQ